MIRSSRFNLIERLRLNDLKKEQSEVGTVDPSEIAKAGKVRGVDYMFFGAITNFKVTVNKTRTGGGAFDYLPGKGLFGFDASKTEASSPTKGICWAKRTIVPS